MWEIIVTQEDLNESAGANKPDDLRDLHFLYEMLTSAPLSENSGADYELTLTKLQKENPEQIPQWVIDARDQHNNTYQKSSCTQEGIIGLIMTVLKNPAGVIEPDKNNFLNSLNYF